MKVILKQHVKFLGEPGEVKDVAEGYAINFLLPQGLAVAATTDNIERLETKRRKQSQQAVMELKEAEKLAKSLDGLQLSIKAKVNENGTLYAAVTPKHLSGILKKKKFDISKVRINLPEPIKELGEFEFMVSLPHGLEAHLTITVES